MKQTKAIAILLSCSVLTTLATENSGDHLDQLQSTNNNETKKDEATTDLLGSLCGTCISTLAVLSSLTIDSIPIQCAMVCITGYHLYDTRKNYHRIKDLKELKKN